MHGTLIPAGRVILVIIIGRLELELIGIGIEFTVEFIATRVQSHDGEWNTSNNNRRTLKKWTKLLRVSQIMEEAMQELTVRNQKRMRMSMHPEYNLMMENGILIIIIGRLHTDNRQ